MSTLGEGMNAGFPGLYNTLSSKLGSLKERIGNWWNGCGVKKTHRPRKVRDR